MMPLLRLIGIGSLLLAAAAATPATAQGRGDHDTPATQRQSESGGAKYVTPDCRTNGDGWILCRDGDGYWQRDRYDAGFGDWWDGGADEWPWGPSRRPPPDVIIVFEPQ